MSSDDNITYNHLRLNINKFYNLKLYLDDQRTILKLTWLYIHNQYKVSEFEDFTYNEQCKKLGYNCSYAGYSKFVN